MVQIRVVEKSWIGFGFSGPLSLGTRESPGGGTNSTIMGCSKNTLKFWDWRFDGIDHRHWMVQIWVVQKIGFGFSGPLGLGARETPGGGSNPTVMGCSKNFPPKSWGWKGNISFSRSLGTGESPGGGSDSTIMGCSKNPFDTW